VFFGDDDFRFYLSLIQKASTEAGAEVWAYCLMPNHIHFVVTPSNEDGLRATFAEAHRRYTSWINARLGTTGHLWQGRFASTPMDERHLIAAVRYIALNPVRAGLARRAADWPWSSVHAHLAGRDGQLVRVAPILERVGDFAGILEAAEDIDAVAALRKSYSTGRPLGSREWIAELETQTARRLAPAQRGRKPL
jgi:putative transposase